MKKMKLLLGFMLLAALQTLHADFTPSDSDPSLTALSFTNKSNMKIKMEYHVHHGKYDKVLPIELEAGASGKMPFARGDQFKEFTITYFSSNNQPDAQKIVINTTQYPAGGIYIYGNSQAPFNELTPADGNGKQYPSRFVAWWGKGKIGNINTTVNNSSELAIADAATQDLLTCYMLDANGKTVIIAK